MVLAARGSVERSHAGREIIWQNHQSASTNFHAHVFTPPRRRAPLHRNFTLHDASSSKATISQQGTRNHHEKEKPITVNSSQATKLPKTKIQNQKSKQTTPSRGTTPRQMNEEQDRSDHENRKGKEKKKRNKNALRLALIFAPTTAKGRVCGSNEKRCCLQLWLQSHHWAVILKSACLARRLSSQKEIPRPQMTKLPTSSSPSNVHSSLRVVKWHCQLHSRGFWRDRSVMKKIRTSSWSD